MDHRHTVLLGCLLVIPLLPDEVHVWRASLDQTLSRVLRHARMLSPDEQLRVERYYCERDRVRFIVSRGALRAILGQYVDIAPNRLQFRYGPHGKPALTEDCGGAIFQFNLSHSEGLALIAVTCQRAIGIDLEIIRPFDHLERMSNRLFSCHERVALRSLPASLKLEGFFKCWTCKEAYVKACGDGLTRPLHQFDVLVIPGQPAQLLSVHNNAQEACRWTVMALRPAHGYAAALAVKGHGWRLKHQQWLV